MACLLMLRHVLLVMQVQQLAASFIQGWVEADPSNRLRLSALGLNSVLADVATTAVARGEAGQPLQLQICRYGVLVEAVAGAGGILL